jgi:uncharacterized membrane protein
MPTFYLDLLGGVVTAGLFATYFVAFAGRLRRDPQRILQGLNSLARARWAAWVLGDASRAITAVQTFRNGIMAGTFFASVAMLLVLGSLNLMGQESLAGAAWRHLRLPGSHAQALQMIKSLLLVADFVVAFFSFALSVRLLVHAAYHLLPAPGEEALAPRRLAGLLDRSALYYTYGMRAYWVAVPLVFWLFSPVLMVLAAILVVAMLFRLDRAGALPFGAAPPA